MGKLASGMLVIGLMIGAAACGVDKAGTADELIKGIEEGGVELDESQETCVRDSISNRSDDELKDLEKMIEDGDDSEEVNDFMAEVIGCVGG